MSKARVGSASMETRMLRDTVTRLEEELMCSQAEQKKVLDQLNCLIMLVKKAWNGDKSAAVHVANIVGAAPPDMEHESTGEIEVAVAAKPKSRALNNWAVLTIGLLNREYRILEQELASRQRQHLQLRKQFLEEELLQHRDVLVRQEYRGAVRGPGDGGDAVLNGRQAFTSQGPAVRRNSGYRQTISAEDRPASGKKKPAVRHLYRPATREANKDPVMVTDLFVGSAHNQNKQINNTNKAMDGLYQLEPLENGHGDLEQDYYEDDPDRQDLDYADPRRYSMFGLFDSDMGPNAATKKGRPPSGKQQKQSDSMRARPKSAAVLSGRPLKYETTRPVSNTRPVSGHVGNRSATKPRAKSASAKLTTSSSSLQDRNLMTSTFKDPRSTASHGQIPTSLGFNDFALQDLDADPDEERPPTKMKIEIRKPESVVRFEEDLHRMERMEEDFKKTTLDLQKKLGISPSGIVY